MSPEALSRSLVAHHQKLALVDLLANQAAWWWAVALAARGYDWTATAGPLAYVLAQLVLGRDPKHWLRIGAIAGALGGLGDTLLLRVGLLEFPAWGSDAWSPPFMVALWAAFGVSLRSTCAFLLNWSMPRCILLAACAGPLAYLGGQRLDAIRVIGQGWPWVALEWSILVCAIVRLARAKPVLAGAQA